MSVTLQPYPVMPAGVEVGPFLFRIVVGGHEHDLERANERMPSLQGHCSHERQLITIKEGMPHDFTADTLLHETLHACLGVAGQPMEKDDEETFVSAITATLLLVLRRNPVLVDFLLTEGD